MSDLYWLRPEWKQAVCACGTKIWPDGDPDWGQCFECFTLELNERLRPEYREPQGEEDAGP